MTTPDAEAQQAPDELENARLADLNKVLADTLAKIKIHDADYAVRYGLVLTAVALAHSAGYRAGFRLDPKEPQWPVAYIELPTGQVSWHMPEHVEPWDEHTTEQKYARVDDFVRWAGNALWTGSL